MNPSVINETVKAARDFLNAELGKYESYEELPNLLINLLEGDSMKAKHNAFEKVKRGVGQTTILKFLGKGWKQWMIQDALDTLKDDEIDRNFYRTVKIIEQ